MQQIPTATQHSTPALLLLLAPCRGGLSVALGFFALVGQVGHQAHQIEGGGGVGGGQGSVDGSGWAAVDGVGGLPGGGQGDDDPGPV